MIEVLANKLQEVVVTHSSVGYKGSITIDEDIMDKADLSEYQAVDVNNHNGNRDKTYILKGKRGSGVIAINGALSKRHKKGDKVHVLAYKYIMERLYSDPIVVETLYDKKNNANLIIK